MSALHGLLERRLELGDFEWRGGSVSPEAWRLLQVNIPELAVEAVPRDSPSGDLVLQGAYSAVVRMFALCSERLIAALRQAESPDPDDAALARDDTLRRLLRFWPPLEVASHTPAHLGHHDTGFEPEYVPRDADAMLDRMLATGGLVVVTGGAYSGHRRTALEALRRHAPSAPMWLPEDGRALARLAHDAGTPALPGSVAYLRLLAPFLGNHGLTSETLAGFMTRTGATVVVGTMSHDELSSPEDRLAALGARVIDVPRELSQLEIDRARRVYPGQAEAMASKASRGRSTWSRTKRRIDLATA